MDEKTPDPSEAAHVPMCAGTRVSQDLFLGNSEPELHAHVFPRSADEAEEFRIGPVFAYKWSAAPSFGPEDEPMRTALRAALR